MTLGESVDSADEALQVRDLFRELRAALKDGGRDTQRSLQAIVELLATHFRSDVCSLYQLDEASAALFLRATEGLRAEAVGRTSLRLGEGLVGTTAETRRPLALECAQADERFTFRPETGEEIYQSFLGVPLVRAQTLLGVLVVQHREPRRYSREEVEDCETVAQFLSEMLHQVSERDSEHPDASPLETLRLPAVCLSPGLAIGKAVFHLKDIVIRRWRSSDPGHELVRMQCALQEMEQVLETLLHQPNAASDTEMRELLEAELMLFRDKGWRRKIEAAIGRGLSAEAAVQTVREDLRTRMKAISNDYIRARLFDLDELSHRLLVRLTGEDQRPLAARLSPDSILICRALGVAELLQIGRGALAGLVVVDATASSHLAITASSLQIPALGQVPPALTELRDADQLILDAVNGQLIARPEASVLAEFESHIGARRARRSGTRLAHNLPCRSRDGVPMHVMANAGLLLDLDEVARHEALGIGLYRTEMAFLVRASLPSVEEQTALYRRVYDRMGDRPVVFRTLDLGSDKKLPGFHTHQPEANPALGWRAIRVGLDHPELLRTQVLALLMAADGRSLRVMFPMISEVEEFVAARQSLADVLDDHRKQGGRVPERLEVGVMIEVPALLWDLDRLLHLVDFASVGTNDLFQFLNAADRNNARTDRRFEVLKPTSLRLLSTIAETARRHGTPVSVCGELAGTPLGAIALVGCGYRSFSVSASRVQGVKSVINALDVSVVRDRVRTLEKEPAASVRAEMADLARSFGIALP